MRVQWPRKNILGALASWYLLVNCLIPFIHRCDASHYTCKLDWEGCGAIKSFCPAHEHYLDQSAEPSTLNEGMSASGRASGHLCLICAYLYKSKWAKSAPTGLLAGIHSRGRSGFVCVGTCHVIHRPWSTSIILRAPPISIS